MDPLTDLLIALRLPPAAASVLSTLMREMEPMTLGELAEATGYAKSHLSSAIRLLEEKSLVERLRDRRGRPLFRARERSLSKLVEERLREIHFYLRSVAAKTSSESVLDAVRVLETELSSLLRRLEEVEE